MNEYTKKFYAECESFRNFYKQNKEELDNVKCFSQMIPLLLEMLEMCNREFRDSIAYMKDYNRLKTKRLHEIAILSNRIKMAVCDYYVDHNLDIDIHKDVFLLKDIHRFSDTELLEHYYEVNEIVLDIRDGLRQYGISENMLNEFNKKIHEIIPAVPIDVQEIENHKRRYFSALQAVRELELYLEFK